MMIIGVSSFATDTGRKTPVLAEKTPVLAENARNVLVWRRLYTPKNEFSKYNVFTTEHAPTI